MYDSTMCYILRTVTNNQLKLATKLFMKKSDKIFYHFTMRSSNRIAKSREDKKTPFLPHLLLPHPPPPPLLPHL